MQKLLNGLYIVWVIAAKDMAEAVQSRLVISLILASLVVLSIPRLIPRMVVQTSFPIAVYDEGNSSLVAALENDAQVNVLRTSSFQDLEALIGSPSQGVGPKVGLVIPADFDLVLAAEGQPRLNGYVAWANRFDTDGLREEWEARLRQILDRPVSVDVEGHLVYPSPDSVAAGILTVSGITIVLVMGLVLVPHLLLEEKQTRTIDALLVSPANAGQIVAGKAVTGFFYTLVTAAVLMAFYGTYVAHWSVALLFVSGCGLFAVAIGLVMGSFFESAQEITGWLGLIIVLLSGAMLLRLLSFDLPAFVETLLPWVPSVALVEIYRLAMVEEVSGARLWSNLGVVLAGSVLLYALVIWQVRRSDR